MIAASSGSLPRGKVSAQRDGHERLQEGKEQFFLAGEIFVDGAFGNMRGLCDFPRGGAGEAM